METSYSLTQVAEHNSMDDAWIILNNCVYDISDFLEEESNHPGGFSLIVEYLGKDISVRYFPVSYFTR